MGKEEAFCFCLLSGLLCVIKMNFYVHKTGFAQCSILSLKIKLQFMDMALVVVSCYDKNESDG